MSALVDVQTERARQDEKWGEQNHSDGVWLSILTEEVGEVAQEILHLRFEAFDLELNALALRDEVIQVAAVAVAWADALRRRVDGAFS